MNQRTRIKVCGITRVQDAVYVAEKGSDAIGLIFHQPSLRAVDLEQALEIRRALPPFTAVTAVFLDESEDWIAEVVHRLRPDCLQFHGNEAPAFCEAWEIPYIKAIPMGTIDDPSAYAQEYPQAQGFLLDSNAAGRRGGSGDTFDWSKIPSDFGHPLVLAGGINSSNVAEAIVRITPWAVDVLSGVEASRGIKSSEMIDHFFREVERGDATKAKNSRVD
jgi:phosphoribosylanthranilate isomerase